MSDLDMTCSKGGTHGYWQRQVVGYLRLHFYRCVKCKTIYKMTFDGNGEPHMELFDQPEVVLPGGNSGESL